MNTEELKQARKQYIKLLKEKKELIEKKEELEKLKKSPEVLKYLELIKYEDTEIPDEEIILDQSFWDIAFHTKNEKNIYVYMGSFYKKDELSNFIFIRSKRTLNKLDNYYNRYWNLETTTSLFIERKDVHNFEKENNIIKFTVPIAIRNECFFQNKFYEVRRKYFKLLTKNTEEQAISKIKMLIRKDNNVL